MSDTQEERQIIQLCRAVISKNIELYISVVFLTCGIQ